MYINFNIQISKSVKIGDFIKSFEINTFAICSWVQFEKDNIFVIFNLDACDILFILTAFKSKTTVDKKFVERIFYPWNSKLTSKEEKTEISEFTTTYLGHSYINCPCLSNVVG